MLKKHVFGARFYVSNMFKCCSCDYATRILAPKGALLDYLQEIDAAANRRMEQLMPEQMKANGVTGRLKASNPMIWVDLMNSLKAQAEIILIDELICSESISGVR